jgi:8-oxo-dGTP pyrophosphatase MutT (NUDIX family)
LDYEASNLEGDHAVSGLLTAANINTGITLRAAAVLVPLIGRADGLTVLLTRRTEHLVHHAGQVSFPGGRAEADDNGPVATALRESQEEIGLAPEGVEVLGLLAPYQTGTGFRVIPVVGFVKPPVQLQADPNEVDEIFEVPLAFLLNPANHQRHSRVYQGQRRYYYAMPYGDYYIWGATAAMLVGLARTLAV